MSEKQEYIVAYINNLAVSLNKQYSGMLPSDKIQKAINMFKDSSKELPEIIEDIEQWKANLIREYLKKKKNKQMISNEDKSINDDIISQETNTRKEEIEQLQDLRESISELNPVNNLEPDIKGKEQTIGKQKKLGTYPKPQNSGFANGLLFTLLFGMASGAIVTMSYILSNIDKYTFMIK